MKLSFSLSSKPSSSRPASKHPQSFEGGRDREREEGRRVGAENGEAKPRFVTVFDPSETLASDAPAKRVIVPIPNSDIWSHKKVKNLRTPSEDPPSESRFVLDTSGNGSDEPAANHYGLMLRSNGEVRASGLSEDRTKRMFQEETKDLPDEELPDVPVDGFGAAILAGYGWSEGKGIGRNSKEDAKVFEYKRRSGTEGFGYVPNASNLKASGKKSNKEEIAAGLETRRGREADNLGRDGKKDESRKKEKRNTDSRREEKSREVKRNSDEEAKPAEKSPVRWLRSHIRVRIISKKVGGGKLYLKKGEVVDVVGPTICDVSMDGSKELVQGVDQYMLETALPKRGGSVLVLYGKHKGVFGSLVERDFETEMGLVRDADGHALINVSLEQIAEYVGDPSYLGY